MSSFFWTQKQDIGPSNRTSHGLTYDGERMRVVLFGGDRTRPRAASAMVAAATIVLFRGVNSIDLSLPSANRIIYGDS